MEIYFRIRNDAEDIQATILYTVILRIQLQRGYSAS